MQEWRLLTTGYHDGAMNMAIDEAITLSMTGGKVPPTLRFYGWKPRCLSLGYAQRTEEVEWDECLEQEIEVVRRSTGGRAILHDQEVTYSVIAPEDNPLVSGSVLQSYLKISQGLLLGLQNLGLSAEMVSHKDLGALGTAACFDSPSSYELVVNGKKVVGSAQKRKNGILLQHGSIIREIDVELIFNVLKFPTPEIRTNMKQAFRRKACSLQEATGHALSDGEIMKAVSEGFSRALGVELINGALQIEEQNLALDLVKSRYGTVEWTKKR
ncbi:MAG TPA: lipoate--protein ligase family protein [Desulfosporosinus sp.]|nr:lipoate--protein ligase family protein [Desulfosporosinus sp.]